ncbi:MAG: hypothetical protein LC737_03035, partial [Chloroflexi bacterium]|nr:hypothetical protein [Chloroflexota bacterium]
MQRAVWRVTLLALLEMAALGCSPSAPAATPTSAAVASPTRTAAATTAATSAATSAATAVATTAASSTATRAATTSATSAATPAATSAGTSATGANIPEVAIIGTDYAFQAPSTITSGWTRVKFSNNGKEMHHAQFFRLKENVTLQLFQQAIAQGAAQALALVDQPGGADAIDPTLSDSVVINLAPGTYVLICLLQSADGVPHAAKGMVLPVRVVPGTVPQTTEPTAAQTVTMTDFLFDMPTSFGAGKVVVEVVNNGPQPHEWGVLQLAPGKTGKD